MNKLRSVQGLLRATYPLAAKILAPFPREFGAFEVFLHARKGSIEWISRHLRILNELERIRRAEQRASLRVLDFGGSGGSLAQAMHLYGLVERYELVLVDIDREAVERAPLHAPLVEKHVVSPDGNLPFGDGAFDVVVSSDVFEHIPKEYRQAWAKELDRVSMLAQIHTVPCDSKDGLHDSSSADLAFSTWFEGTFGQKERWTLEHLENGVPTHSDLARLFEPARLDSFANTSVWAEVVRAQFHEHSRLRRIRRALRYVILQKQADRKPPFKACLVVSERLTPLVNESRRDSDLSQTR